jgi:hypothetical protein
MLCTAKDLATFEATRAGATARTLAPHKKGMIQQRPSHVMYMSGSKFLAIARSKHHDFRRLAYGIKASRLRRLIATNCVMEIA